MLKSLKFLCVHTSKYLISNNLLNKFCQDEKLLFLTHLVKRFFLLANSPTYPCCSKNLIFLDVQILVRISRSWGSFVQYIYSKLDRIVHLGHQL